MMSLRLTPPLPLLFLIMISRVVSQSEWSVTYTPSSICAVKGSTVTMGCTYTYPSGYTVQRAFWSREIVTDKEPPDLLSDPNYRDRVQYFRDNLNNCRLRLSDVREQDRGKYYFRFLTNPEEKYQGPDGVELFVTVTEFQVEMFPDTVVEGDEVTLTCKTTCSLTETPTFTWYKDGHYFSSSNPLRLPSVSQRDAGRYSCSVQGQSYLSAAVTLNVQYPPKSVSVSISPSGVIVEGSSVTLTCSSDANPPVQNYTWYKVNESSPVGSGQSYSFTLTSSSSGGFYCVVQNRYGRQRSPAGPLTLNSITGRSVVLYVVLGVIVGCGCLLAIVGVLCIRRKRTGRSGDNAESRQNVSCSPTDDTYTALDLQTRSSDVYDTLTTVHPNLPDSQSISHDYENNPVSASICSSLNIVPGSCKA
ncbi:B-cell receptor CD22-like [Hemibagrus wyckioides]|uniref:B-cell receptor CD22-like n=1 Tax=Hemibagrus wyckioides TaxID=337641 RepID=UPI00266D64A0|nr:B-cell receptor CD22-like [Hemibagrus wyckioides]